VRPGGTFPAAWAVRGLLDRLAGGVGLRRGRRDPRQLRVGDALDFWRVEAITPGSLLRLRAEMKLPGLAWLEMAAGRDHDGMTTYSQRAIFQPRGLAGHAYWRSISPFHGVVFGGMLATSPPPPRRPTADKRDHGTFGCARAELNSSTAPSWVNQAHLLRSLREYELFYNEHHPTAHDTPQRHTARHHRPSPSRTESAPRHPAA
jgi:Protein of unknown function (DUF2867)